MVAGAVTAAYARAEVGQAIEAVGTVTSLANRYFSDAQPWTLRARASEAHAARLDTVLHVSLLAARAACTLLHPAVPAGTARALARLGETAAPTAAGVRATAEASARLPGRPLGAVPGTAVPFPRLAAATQVR
jgi:methionyl-tRNA synthetase